MERRLTLKGGVREILATEMLEALGVNTSKTFSIIETGEQLIRGDEPSPTRSAVMVRLSHSHIRIGSFQRVAAEGDAEFMQQLIAYCLTQLYDVTPAENPAAQLLGLAVERVADLAASYNCLLYNIDSAEEKEGARLLRYQNYLNEQD